jgi:catecholate siderophore receptor
MFSHSRFIISSLTLIIAFSSYDANAQQALPTIDVGKRKQITSTKPARPTKPIQTAQAPLPAPPAAAPTFIPQGEQLWRGPTNVNGYFAGGTSTATKTNTKIIDIPQSVTIITQQQLQDRNSLTLNQALSYVPGVTVTQGEGNTDAITIRGQATTSNFYTDNVRDDAEYYRDLYATQSVEVLKGPSAIIFGRGGGGGIVNRVTKKADGVERKDMQISTGSFGRKRVSVDVGNKISDTLAYRFNGLYEQSYNWRDKFHMERYGISPSFTLKPTDKDLFTLNYEHYYDRRIADRGVPGVGGTVLGGMSVNPAYPLDTPNYAFYGSPSMNYSKAAVDRAQLMLDHTFENDLNVKNQVVYAHYGKIYQNVYPNYNLVFANTLPKSTLPWGQISLLPNQPGNPSTACKGLGATCIGLSGYNNYQPRQDIFNQTDFTYNWQMTPQIKHVILFGSEVANQKTDTNRANAIFNNPITGGTSIYEPSYASALYTPVYFSQLAWKRHTDLDIAAGYIQDQIAVTKYIDIVGGIRYDMFNLRFVSGSNEIVSSGIANYWGQSISNLANVWSPRAAVIVKPIDNLSLYASYSRSYLPQSGDQFNNLSVTTATLDPQSFVNYEVGFKYEFTPRLLVTGALYELYRGNQFLTANAYAAVLANTKTAGGEFAITGYMNNEWQVSLGYGNQNAFITQSNRQYDATQPFYVDIGKRVPNVPKNNFSYWNKYDVSWMASLKPETIGAGLGVIYQSALYPAVDNFLIMPGWARMDGAAYFKLSDNISGQVNIENILGARYYVAAQSNTNITPGSPRAAYVTLNGKF